MSTPKKRVRTPKKKEPKPFFLPAGATLSKPAQEFSAVADHGGEKVTTGNGALREVAAGKGRFDLIPSYPIKRLAIHYENGAKKYAPRNWEKGIPLSRFLDSAERHTNLFKDGDRSEDHLAAILWNYAGYIWTEREIHEGRLPAELSDVPWDPSISGFEPIEPVS